MSEKIDKLSLPQETKETLKDLLKSKRNIMKWSLGLGNHDNNSIAGDLLSWAILIEKEPKLGK